MIFPLEQPLPVLAPSWCPQNCLTQGIPPFYTSYRDDHDDDYDHDDENCDHHDNNKKNFFNNNIQTYKIGYDVTAVCRNGINWLLYALALKYRDIRAIMIIVVIFTNLRNEIKKEAIKPETSFWSLRIIFKDIRL